MIYPVIAGVVGGCLYYNMMEKSLPDRANCSFIATPATDYLAFVWGAIVMYYGNVYKNDVLIFMGVSLIVEHIFQFMRK